MHPICLHLGPLTIHWYGVLAALGFLAGLVNWTWLGRKRGRDLAFCSDLLFWIMVSGILGARLAYVALNFSRFAGSPIHIFFIHEGGLVFYGGVIGSTLAVFVFARLRRQPTADLFDFVVTSLPLGHTFGRIGCFLNGCCHGVVYGGRTGIQYPRGSVPWWSQVEAGIIDESALAALPVHPTQIYEAILNVVIYILVARAYRRKHAPGAVIGLYFILYPVMRFVLEYLRGDQRSGLLGLSAGQVVSLGLLACGCALVAWSRRTQVEPTPEQTCKAS